MKKSKVKSWLSMWFWSYPISFHWCWEKKKVKSMKNMRKVKMKKMKKWKLEVMTNKSLNVNKLLAREVHVYDSELDTWGAHVVLRNLYLWCCMYPKFLEVDRISISVVLKRKWITTYRLNLGVTIGLKSIETRKYEAIHFSTKIKYWDTKTNDMGVRSFPQVTFMSSVSI